MNTMQGSAKSPWSAQDTQFLDEKVDENVCSQSSKTLH